MLRMQVADSGLLCHQAALQLQPLLQAEAAQAGTSAELAELAAAAADMLEKPSCWLVVSMLFSALCAAHLRLV
jgi:hypothetical protein